MLQDIFNLTEFCVITFPNTQSALQAEKILTEEGAEFVLIPTPREISASCGLAVKCSRSNSERYLQILKAKRVPCGDTHYFNRPPRR
ncbi:hypothetical protein Tfer_0300 [Thermincola ferriacetica]|uniref:Putative Se/S carrier protein-like domain-containing protein n=2 Tax=Thermincola TaxID=278993 RepID=D5XEY2_THEPJ|nr:MULTISPECIES: DUF3343 domain-containing protein [Thermincola]ADG82203.1 conserved hypothetical protein [Thermincola potens JR]KNZ71221.1 hypothetical protein Tfer_0300 [Thermincola ferriacetica]